MNGPRIASLTSVAQVLDRQSRMLRSALGPVIAGALADPDIVEILLNPDGSLWFDRLGAGRTPSGITMPALRMTTVSPMRMSLRRFRPRCATWRARWLIPARTRVQARPPA